MAPGDHRRQSGVASRSAGKDVANAVDGDIAAGLLAPPDKEAPRFAIEIAGGKPAHPAPCCGADLCQLHQACPQPFGVDLKIAHGLSSDPGLEQLDTYPLCRAEQRFILCCQWQPAANG